jgi:hypothetical protein
LASGAVLVVAVVNQVQILATELKAVQVAVLDI